MGFEKVRHIDLPKICDPRGNLSFLENGGVVPFPIARTYWVYDVPGGKKRFGHAFHRQEELPWWAYAWVNGRWGNAGGEWADVFNAGHNATYP